MVPSNKSSPLPERALKSLGINEGEESVYRWILKNPGSSSSEVAQALRLVPRTSQRLLETIEDKGLVTHSPERPKRYWPSAPDIALGALFLQRQKALLETQKTIEILQEQLNVSRRGNEQRRMVELISSREAERQIMEQMDRTVEREFITLIREPMRVTKFDKPAEEDHPAQREALKRGVKYRTVIETGLMENPAIMKNIYSDMIAGEKVRMISGVPLKLILADRRLALIPLRLGELNSPALLIRTSSLLDALYELFEMLWKRAVPITFSNTRELVGNASEVELGEEIKGLISLMAVGLNDKTIAYDLNISKRTLERRIAALMQAVDARTRFQAGWLAALRLSGGGFDD